MHSAGGLLLVFICRINGLIVSLECVSIRVAMGINNNRFIRFATLSLKRLTKHLELLLSDGLFSLMIIKHIQYVVSIRIYLIVRNGIVK